MTSEQQEQQSYQVGNDTPVSLKTIVKQCLPDGSITIRKLKKKVEDGMLVAWDIDGELLTSRAQVERMLDKCRAKPNRHDCGSANHDAQSQVEALKRGSTSSFATVAKLARDAAVMNAQQLKRSSRNSSSKDT